MSEYFKSFSIVYKREYIDSEDQHDPNFFIGPFYIQKCSY